MRRSREEGWTVLFGCILSLASVSDKLVRTEENMVAKINEEFQNVPGMKGKET